MDELQPEQRRSSGQRSDPTVENYLRTIQGDRKVTDSIAGPRFRRIAGLLLGLSVGLLYGLVSQGINPISLGGVRLYQSPLGTAGNCAFCLLVGALAGLATAWPSGAINGMALGSAAAWLALEARSLILGGRAPFVATDNPVGIGALTLGALALMSPILFALSLPATMVIRWATQVQGERQTEPFFAWQRIRPVLAVLIVAAVAGTITLYPVYVRQALIGMNDLIRAGRSSGSTSALPAPLQSEHVSRFVAEAKGSFTLEWDESLSDALRSDTSSPMLVEQGQPVAAIRGRFESGYTLVCVFVGPTGTPTCWEERSPGRQSQMARGNLRPFPDAGVAPVLTTGPASLETMVILQ